MFGIKYSLHSNTNIEYKKNIFFFDTTTTIYNFCVYKRGSHPEGWGPWPSAEIILFYFLIYCIL